MKKVIAINTCDYGSTGKIMLQIAEKIRQRGGECKIVVPTGRHNPWKNKADYFRLGNRLSEDSHILLGYVTGYQGCFSVFSTLCLVRRLKAYHPDIIHMHNLHKCYINLPILFRYLKAADIQVIWTLHDCWAFTGQCPHFTLVKCKKWKIGCHDCPSYREYPQSAVDRTKTMWKLKKKWFTGVENMTIVTPSQWLADLVKQSYLKDYPVKVIHNGIDLSIFKPTQSNFREKYNIPENKFILLGVAFGWGKRKGLDVFVELSKRLDSDKYQIVLVGTDDTVDKQLPSNIISIHRTQNQTELAEIYTAADLFVNPTREEVLGLVNLEAQACGTPVITFKTGGSPECICEKTGIVVDCDDVDALAQKIEEVRNDLPFTTEDCLKHAKEFDKQLRFEEYINLLTGE